MLTLLLNNLPDLGRQGLCWCAGQQLLKAAIFQLGKQVGRPAQQRSAHKNLQTRDGLPRQ